MGGAPSVPAAAPLPPTPPPPPTAVDPAVLAARQDAATAAANAVGRGATIMTSPAGVLDSTTSKGKTLLGQ